MRGYFEKAIETETRRCEICGRDTMHDRTLDGAALWMCRDPKHPHPTRGQQAGTISVVRVMPPMYDKTDYFRACTERDQAVARCKDLEKKLEEIRKVATVE
jgi:hypothetical protein